MSHLRSTRQIALRAAMAVTGLAASGCYTANQNLGDTGPRADAVVVPDAVCSYTIRPETEASCIACGFYWNASANECVIAVPGPFVPPSIA